MFGVAISFMTKTVFDGQNIFLVTLFYGQNIFLVTHGETASCFTKVCEVSRRKKYPLLYIKDGKS